MKPRKPLKRTGFIRRRTRLKAASTKRRKRNAEVRDFRQAFVLEIGCCELCGLGGLLDVHEVAGGWARSRSLDKRYAILALCRGCHSTIETEPAIWTVARQLALLRARRPMDYDLVAINKLLTRQVDAEQVDFAAAAIRL